MDGRGPRGQAGGGHRILKPIAWGSVTWAAGVPSWLTTSALGGEFGARAPEASGAGPVLTALALDRPHDKTRLHVQVSPQGSGYAYEEPAIRTGNVILVYTANTSSPFAVTVYEEQ